MADDTLDIIDKLIETCRDGQAGYRDAAEHTSNPGLKEFFLSQSLERAKFSGELESMAQRLGEADPNRGPSVSNKIQRAWFDLKQKFGGGDTSILESVESGEDQAKKDYQEALRSPLPLDVKTVIERQAESVFATHQRVRALRDQYRRVA